MTTTRNPATMTLEQIREELAETVSERVRLMARATTPAGRRIRPQLREAYALVDQRADVLMASLAARNGQ